MRMILLGPPGAGKGTLAGLLKNKFGLLHISTGDILREEMKQGTPLGKDMKAYVDRGELVPDEIITKIIENTLTKAAKLSQGFMLDGFPRTQVQAKDLDKILETLKQPIGFALCMQASLPVVLERLTGRRVCRNCGALYHITNKPPKVAGKCDACGGELYQRADDNEKTIRNRMDVYTKNTQPIIEYYKKQKKLMTVNADQETDFLFKELTLVFDEDKRSHKDKIRG